jgi:hypothetical protein
MPKVLDPQTGKTYDVTSAAGLQEYLAAGYVLADDSTGDVALTTPGGNEVAVQANQLEDYAALQPGATSIDPGALVERGRALYEEQAFEEEYGGIGGDIRALAEGGLSGFTLGGYDVAADWLGLDTEKYAQANPNFRLAGEAGALIAATAASGGTGLAKVMAKTPAGALSKGAMSAGAKLGGAGLKGAAVGAGLEGGGYAAAQTISQILISDDPLSAEAAVAEVAKNALFGTVLSGGATAVFGGLGKLGNKIVGGLDDANPVLKLRSTEGRELFENSGKAIREADLSVEDALVQAERGLGQAGKLSPSEVTQWTRVNSDLSAFGTLEKRANEFAAQPITEPLGIAEFTEHFKTVHDDLKVGLGFTGSPQAEALDRAGDKLYKALASNSPDAVLKAVPAYVKQANKVARGLMVDIKEDLAPFIAFEARLKAPSKVVNEEAWNVVSRFNTAKSAFDDLGGLSPESVQRMVVDATEAGAARSTKVAVEYAHASKELSDMLGVPLSREMDELVEGLESMLAAARNPRPSGGIPTMITQEMKTALRDKLGLVDEDIALLTPQNAHDLLRQSGVNINKAHVESMRASQAKFRSTIGLDPKTPFKGRHLTALAQLPIEELAPKLRVVDQFLKDAKAFASTVDDPMLAARMTAVEGYLDDAVKSAFKSAKMDRMTKEAVGMILGAEVLEFSGMEGPVDDLLQLAALHKLLSRAGAKAASGGGSGIVRRMFTRAGSRVAPELGKRMGVVGSSMGGRAAGGMAMAAGYSGGGGLYDALMGQAGVAGLGANVRKTIGNLLENAGKSKAVRPGTLTTAWVARSRFDFGGSDDKEKLATTGTTLRSAFEARRQELLKFAAAPMAAQRVIHEQVRPLRLVSEQLADQIEMQSMEIPQWLYEKLPKDPGTIQTLGVSRWKASEVEILEWAEYGKGALYPMETIEGALNGDLSPQAAESLRTIWPEHFRALQVEILKRAPELADSLSYDQQVRLSILTDIAIDSTMSSEFRRFMLDQEATRQAEQEESMAQPSGSKSTSSPAGEDEFSPAQKLLR